MSRWRVPDTLIFDSDELSPEDSWRLLEWCHARGAEEFSLDCLGSEPDGDQLAQALEELLAPFRRDPAPREQLWALAGMDTVRPTPLWTLDAQSMAHLRRLLPEGLFTYKRGAAWYENVCVYRGTELFLGILTHEWTGFLRLTPQERQELEALFPTLLGPEEA